MQPLAAACMQALVIFVESGQRPNLVQCLLEPIQESRGGLDGQGVPARCSVCKQPIN